MMLNYLDIFILKSALEAWEITDPETESRLKDEKNALLSQLSSLENMRNLNIWQKAWICFIIPVGKTIWLNIHWTNEKPRVCRLWVFLFRKVAYAFMLVAALSSVQPFANIVGGYTCFYRNDKRYDYIHWLTSLLLERVAACKLYHLFFNFRNI